MNVACDILKRAIIWSHKSFSVSYFTSPSAIYVDGDEGDMVDDAMTFYHHISSSNPVHDFFIAMHENHASVVPTTISKALRFIST